MPFYSIAHLLPHGVGRVRLAQRVSFLLFTLIPTLSAPPDRSDISHRPSPLACYFLLCERQFQVADSSSLRHQSE